MAVFVMSLCAFAPGCVRDGNQSGENSIRVGIVTSLTGSEARFGQAQKYGYEMALDEISATGVLGRKLELDRKSVV